MRVIDRAIFIEANPANFYNDTRPSSAIRYIVVHYTGNSGDTARNNALYFHEAKVGSSAHYFVSGKDIYQSVKDYHAAWAVGLGSRTEPYFKWPSMWKKITNNNSISVEICGYPNGLEGDATTKDTAAQLVADLMDKYHLDMNCVYRHYDVTGKVCPAWAVNTPEKWEQFKSLVWKYFCRKEDDEMVNSEENYQVFKQFMDRWVSEVKAKPADWEAGAMEELKGRGLMDGTKPKMYLERGEFATVLSRMFATGLLE